MATPGEFDPTYPEGDRDGAGAAEGGAMGGDSAGDSTLPPPLQTPRRDRQNKYIQSTGDFNATSARGYRRND